MRRVICIFIVMLFFQSVALQAVMARSDETHASAAPVHVMDDVVVTAEKIEEYVKNHPQRVERLDGKEIRERNFLEVGEALNSMPGVDVVQRESGSRITIRGGGGSGGVLVLLNGRPLNSSQYGGIDLGVISIETVKSISVFKPPVPVWLGPQSSGGAVNIVTGNPEGQPARQGKKDKTRIRLAGGSFGMAKASCSWARSQERENTMITVGGSHKDGKRSNSDQDSGNVSLSWDRKNDQLTQFALSGRYYHTEHGSPGPEYNRTPHARQRYDSGGLDFRLKGLSGEIGEFDCKAWLDGTELEDKAENGDKSTLRVFKYGLGGEEVFSHEEGVWALRLGGKAEQDRVDHTLTGDHDREKASLHAQIDYDFGKMTATSGARCDYTNDFHFFPAFNAGLSYELARDTLLKTNIGYSVNVPSFAQLYQPVHGAADQVRGNPDLSEEEIYSYDFGIEHKFSKKSNVEAVLFKTETHDLIAYNMGADKIYRPSNLHRAEKYGVELSFKHSFEKIFSADLNYIWQKTEYRESGDEGDLTYAPEHSGKITLKAVLDDGTRFETLIKAQGSRYGDLENSRTARLDAYANVDFKVVKPVTIKSLVPEIFVHFNNLFDTDFDPHYGYPDDGFRFVGGVNLNF